MNTNLTVLKFSASAVNSRQGLIRASAVISKVAKTGSTPIVILSAAEKVRCRLLSAAEKAARGGKSYEAATEEIRTCCEQSIEYLEDNYTARISQLLGDILGLVQGIALVRDFSRRSKDLLIYHSETLHALAAAQFLSTLEGCESTRFIDACSIIVVRGERGAASIESRATAQKAGSLPGKNIIPIIPGGVGATVDGDVHFLGEDGADYAASVLAAVLGAAELQLWTNVDGIMTADPRKVAKAFTIPQLGYEEAMELCHFGARVIFPRAMQPAFDAGIPIRVKSVQRPDSPGSIITAEPAPHPRSVTGISSISSIVLMRLQGSGMLGVAGIARRLFDTLSRRKISIILISQASSEHSICFAIAPEAAREAKSAIEEEFALEIEAHQIEPVEAEHDLSVVAAVGANMAHTPGISGRLFQALGKNGINVSAIAQGSSELNISVVIRRSDEAKALNAIHDAFFLSDLKTINLFLVGTGQVGAKLLEQLEKSKKNLAELKLELRVVALANRRSMLINADGISLPSWKQALEDSVQKSDLPQLLGGIRSMNLPNSIFVDCTASAEVAACYAELLSGSVSVVTPNKKANSGALAVYRTLKENSARANVKFFYETNVGAGLPVIGTLNDLILSGDQIIRIEAVLSGTLSYIFNTYVPGLRFSDVVREAKKKGYTEPDPRDDLSGTDVARKLLILAREIGLCLELEDISVESLVPDSCRGAADAEEFLNELEKWDGFFSSKLAEAAAAGGALRYIGTINDGKAQVSLQCVGKDHPFYSLSGSDNVISFVTSRYFERPLVVKGPGAGTEVTAAGVLADIIRAAGYVS